MRDESRRFAGAKEVTMKKEEPAEEEEEEEEEKPEQVSFSFEVVLLALDFQSV